MDGSFSVAGNAGVACDGSQHPCHAVERVPGAVRRIGKKYLPGMHRKIFPAPRIYVRCGET